jgi:hypothetical protein
VVLGFEDFFKAFDVRISGQREQRCTSSRVAIFGSSVLTR